MKTVSPHDYDREERREASWWGSRHERGRNDSSGVRKSRRLTLIDMLLLLVMAGILIPWLLSMDRSREAGPYRVSLDRRTRGGQVVLVLEIRLPADAGEPGDEPVGWTIFDEDGRTIHEAWDAPPPSGESREFLFAVPEASQPVCEVRAAGEILVIRPDGGK